jgi:type II secretory pathway component PulM
VKANLRNAWQSRAPRDRLLIASLAALIGVVLYAWLVQSASRARAQLQSSIPALQEQAARLDQQALEVGRLRAAPVAATSATSLRALVEAQAGATGLSRALTRFETPDADRAVVTLGAVAFADWLRFVSGLESQQIRVDGCRIEALSSPGMVGVTATLVRAPPR